MNKAVCLITAMLAGSIALAEEPGAKDRPVKITLHIDGIANQKVTWLGVQASPATEAMRQAAGLPQGVGLKVDFVGPRSPAADAGLKTGDVLHKLDDQLLVNSAQLTALVRSMKPGDEVTLSIVRDTKAMPIKIKLGQTETFEAPAPPPGVHAGMPADVIFWRGNDFAPGAPGASQKLIIRAAGAKQTTTWSDPQHSITLERENGVTRRATVHDLASGKEIFNGALETPEQRNAVPKEIREKLEKAEAAGNVKPEIMWLGGGAGAAFALPAGGASKVRVWQDDKYILVLRFAQSPTYLLALSKKDGRVLFDGPVATPEQRESIPAEVADMFQAVVKNPEMAKEFGSR